MRSASMSIANYAKQQKEIIHEWCAQYLWYIFQRRLCLPAGVRLPFYKFNSFIFVSIFSKFLTITCVPHNRSFVHSFIWSKSTESPHKHRYIFDSRVHGRLRNRIDATPANSNETAEIRACLKMNSKCALTHSHCIMLSGKRQPAADVCFFYAVYAALCVACIVSFSFIFFNSTISRFTFSFLLVMRFKHIYPYRWQCCMPMRPMPCDRTDQVFYSHIENTLIARMVYACNGQLYERHKTRQQKKNTMKRYEMVRFAAINDTRTRQT